MLAQVIYPPATRTVCLLIMDTVSNSSTGSWIAVSSPRDCRWNDTTSSSFDCGWSGAVSNTVAPLPDMVRNRELTEGLHPCRPTQPMNALARTRAIMISEERGILLKSCASMQQEPSQITTPQYCTKIGCGRRRELVYKPNSNGKYRDDDVFHFYGFSSAPLCYYYREYCCSICSKYPTHIHDKWCNEALCAKEAEQIAEQHAVCQHNKAHFYAVRQRHTMKTATRLLIHETYRRAADRMNRYYCEICEMWCQSSDTLHKCNAKKQEYMRHIRTALHETADPLPVRHDDGVCWQSQRPRE